MQKFLSRIGKILNSRLFRYLTYLKLGVKFIILIFFLCSCMTYQDVQFQGVSNFKVDKIDKEQVKLKFDARINNPNNYNITVRANNVDLGVNGKSLAKGDVGKKVVIKKNASDAYPVEVTVKFKDLMSGLGSSLVNMFGGGSINLEIKGNAKVSAKGLSKKFPLEFEYPVNPSDLNLGGMNLFN
ncbi:MAG: LEA type 2 family protein [Crocinitomicaceae bacterium]